MNTTILEQAFVRVRKALPGAKPRCGLILGSGLTGIESVFATKGETASEGLWGAATARIPGHTGRIVLAERAGQETLIFCGRHHWYEGLGWEPVAFPVYLLKKLGASVIVLTNAAGAIRENLAAGDIMVIDDHINAMGANPLTGNTDPTWGPTFADQSNVYDPLLRELLDKAAARAGMPLSHGVYLAAGGPTYETPAEVRAFRAMGADAVGMSTVPEAMLANAAGLRVAGLSCMANKAVGLDGGTISHGKVLAAVQRAVPSLSALLSAFWDNMAGKL